MRPAIGEAEPLVVADLRVVADQPQVVDRADRAIAREIGCVAVLLGLPERRGLPVQDRDHLWAAEQHVPVVVVTVDQRRGTLGWRRNSGRRSTPVARFE